MQMFPIKYVCIEMTKNGILCTVHKSLRATFPNSKKFWYILKICCEPPKLRYPKSTMKTDLVSFRWKSFRICKLV